VLDLSVRGNDYTNEKKENGTNYDYLNNLIDIPFIKVYLLILHTHIY
jgi:hypothetical protein